MRALVEAIDLRLRKIAGVDTDLLKFFVRRRFVGFDVPSTPFFDSDEATGWFIERLARSTRYLEYGSGGSTCTAARLGIEFITVESDPYFAKCVAKKIRADGFARESGQTFHYADIGMTEYVGRPFRAWRASSRRLEKFRRYSDPPAACFADGRLPDLVLVDGRFRVACALKALRMLQKTTGWTIAIDDYVNRPHYHAVAEFAELDRYVGGRMAAFRGAKSRSPQALNEAITRYETVPE